jgi:cytosine/creatinine deaminase
MWALQDARLADGSLVEVSVHGELVSGVSENAAAGAAEVVDCRGHLVVPAFVDAHVHLDKALIRDELNDHDGTLAGAIGAIHERKRRYTVEDVRGRARSVIEESVRHGTTRLRSHVDVDTIGGLVPLEGVMAAAADCADIADVQTIAFPQEGLLRDPGAYELMEAALEAGADVVGGMPHWEQDEAAQREHVRLCFDLAERFDRDLDMHVDETDNGGTRTLEMVADEALRRGFIGRVCAGHVCSLAAADDDYADRVIDKCRRAEISIASNPVTNLVLQGRGDRGLIRRGTTRIAELRAAGVNVFFGRTASRTASIPSVADRCWR